MSKITASDVALIVVLAVVGIYLLGWGNPHSPGGQTVAIRSLTGEVLNLPLDQDRTIEMEGVIGKTRIRIEQRSVEFVSSPCPHKVCIRRGQIRGSGQWIACVPNGVVARISGERGYDGITP